MRAFWWGTLCIVVAAVAAAFVAWLFHIQHPFADTLTWESLRDFVASLVLLGLGGVVLWKLQDRWVRRRIRAEKDFEILREVYRQLNVVRVDVAELSRVLTPTTRDQARANQLLPIATERAYRLADEARLIFDNTRMQANFDLLTAILGHMRPGTVIGEEQLDQLQEAVRAIHRAMLDKMDFGR